MLAMRLERTDFASALSSLSDVLALLRPNPFTPTRLDKSELVCVGQCGPCALGRALFFGLLLHESTLFQGNQGLQSRAGMEGAHDNQLTNPSVSIILHLC